MNQRFNPHTIRVNNVNLFNFHVFDEGMYNRKIKLENIFGINKYKKIINKVKRMGR